MGRSGSRGCVRWQCPKRVSRWRWSLFGERYCAYHRQFKYPHLAPAVPPPESESVDD